MGLINDLYDTKLFDYQIMYYEYIIGYFDFLLLELRTMGYMKSL